jgi:hypothetical protein
MRRPEEWIRNSARSHRRASWDSWEPRNQPSRWAVDSKPSRPALPGWHMRPTEARQGTALAKRRPEDSQFEDKRPVGKQSADRHIRWLELAATLEQRSRRRRPRPTPIRPARTWQARRRGARQGPAAGEGLGLPIGRIWRPWFEGTAPFPRTLRPLPGDRAQHTTEPPGRTTPAGRTVASREVSGQGYGWRSTRRGAPRPYPRQEVGIIVRLSP